MTIDQHIGSSTLDSSAVVVESTATQENRDNWLRRHRRLTATVLLVAVSAVGAGWSYLNQYRVEQQIGPEAAESAIRAATDGTVAILSYSPDTLDGDLAAAKTHLTGEFLTYYGKFSDEIVAPAARENAVDTEAAVVRSGVAEMREGTAKVLVFLNQTTTSKSTAAPMQTASTVMVTMTEVDGAWLISAFDPM